MIAFWTMVHFSIIILILITRLRRLMGQSESARSTLPRINSVQLCFDVYSHCNIFHFYFLCSLAIQFSMYNNMPAVVVRTVGNSGFIKNIHVVFHVFLLECFFGFFHIPKYIAHITHFSSIMSKRS